MATLTIRKLDDAVYERLRERARANHRSLEAEARQLLEEQTRIRAAASDSVEEFEGRKERSRGRGDMVDAFAELRAQMKAKYGTLPDSTDLIRQMRDEE